MLVELLNFKNTKELKAFAKVLIDLSLRHIKMMGKSVPRGVVHLRQVLAVAEKAEDKPMISIAKFHGLCALCEVTSPA